MILAPKKPVRIAIISNHYALVKNNTIYKCQKVAGFTMIQ
jgi:hypothetical protein